MTSWDPHTKASKAIASATRIGGRALLGLEADKVARAYGIRVVKSALARSEKEAAFVAKDLGFPLALKVVSSDILHKSDVGGVKQGVDSVKGVKAAYAEILSNVRRARPNATVEGVLVQRMAPEGHEFVVGATRDQQFGPAVMFGLGGVYVELFRDVSFRLAPLTKKEALDMIDETRASRLLAGFRGSPPLDAGEVAETLVAVGKLITDLPEIDSVDVNPLFVYPKGVLAVDVRMILKKAVPS
ncbi:MAG: acetate--CoA ligase family protein [Nitrososphaerota archaeon]|jgi:acetyl-CoA synthetase (ADP-forming)|nr:acetate--CoA ligase family protein [Nitrososphaerota archaeon]MDG6941656.1 acetate--CoA ligase family protein [Nitrososphaerota archaeon]MDG6947170.1 acetate--CoA ligase family protein [Nitrososphaerota archaeon]MDG6951252.1 acetate--CoA ligase family protein [Nitrososphaerota archaeon]